MASTIDLPPVNDQFVDKDGFLTPVWRSWFARFGDSVQGYFTENGLLLPTLTTAQRDAITTPQTGTMIQNSTVGEPQIYENGAWHNINYT